MYLIEDWVACHVKYINSNIPPFRDYTKNNEQQVSFLKIKEVKRQSIKLFKHFPLNHNNIYTETYYINMNKNSLDEIANVNFYAVRPEATRIRWTQNNAITPFKVIQDHRFWYQSKTHIRFPISN